MYTGLFVGQPPPSIPVLNAWLDDHNVQRVDGVEIAPMASGSGLRLVATRDLDVGETICKIPKSALLSTRTSPLPMLSRPSSTTTSHTILGLALALLHELRLGVDSDFWGYIQSLPREAVPIPTLWPLEDAGSDAQLAIPWLRGTEAERDLRRREREGVGLVHLRAFYDAALPHLPPTRLHAEPSPFDAFAYAFSLVSTRAFVVDLYHMVALCPFADILNHSANSHTSLASDDFVCHKCGQLSSCDHDVLGPNDLPARLEHVSPAEVERIEHEPDTVDMYVEWGVPAGREVMNSYGEKIGEARLLVEWGFVPGSRPDPLDSEDEEDADNQDLEDDADEHFAGDGVTWDIDEVVDESLALEWIEREEGDPEALLLFPLDASTPTTAEGFADDSALICAPSDREGVYHLNYAGQVSLRIFGALHLAETKRLGDTNSTLVSDINHLEAAWEHIQNSVDVPTLAPTLLATAKAMRALIADRLDGMNRPKLSVGDLYDLREDLAPDADLQAMALTIVINEVALLRSALERWDDLLQFAGDKDDDDE